jgi:hypothetical protein
LSPRADVVGRLCLLTAAIAALPVAVAPGAAAQTLPAPPCAAMPPIGAVALSAFQSTYDTPAGHFTIHYGLAAQEAWDPTGTCFPPIWNAGVNTRNFVATVGSLLEQV